MRAELAAALAIGREAGAILRAGAGRAHAADQKRTTVDLVTEYDKRSEAHIAAQLRAAFPGDELMAEEGGGHAGASGRRWVVDPLDGTTNFAHGLPFFCVSIGLEDAAGPLVGVVEAPALGWTFYAARGEGAFLVDAAKGLEPRRLAVSATATLGASVLATGFPYDNATSAQNNFAAWVHMYKCTQGLRRVGAAALDLCMLAAGWFDGYWEMKLKPWDVAAGALVVLEAGGRVTDYRGGPFRSDDGELLASNGLLHDAIAAELARVA